MGISAKEKFLKIYANIPFKLREEIILTLDEKSMTWGVAYFEVINNTPASKIILEKLEKLGLI